MSKEKTKEEIIQHKKLAIRKINSLLEEYIASENKNLLKKCDLMSYWIEEYSNYIKTENIFDSKRLKSYRRGDIIKLNFGFNVGSEYGGLHYAVVINNSNPRNSSVITVIPLTSYKNKSENEIHPDDVFLGNEIYKALKLKHDTILQNLEVERKETLEYKEAIDILEQLTDDTLGKILTSDSDSPTFEEDILKVNKYADALQKLQTSLTEKLQQNSYCEEQLNKIGAEIAHMKAGSIALVNLITTVSKMRIYDPKNSKGVLSGVHLSEDSMICINNKLKTFFIHE